MVTSYAFEHLPPLGMWAFRQNHASCDAVSTTREWQSEHTCK